jgi:hypothetical protein
VTDKQLIFNFIDKNFILSINNGKYIFIEKRNNEEIYFTVFVYIIRKVFGDFISIEGTVYDIFIEWFESESIKINNK